MIQGRSTRNFSVPKVLARKQTTSVIQKLARERRTVELCPLGGWCVSRHATVADIFDMQRT